MQRTSFPDPILLNAIVTREQESESGEREKRNGRPGDKERSALRDWRKRLSRRGVLEEFYKPSSDEKKGRKRNDTTKKPHTHIHRERENDHRQRSVYMHGPSNMTCPSYTFCTESFHLISIPPAPRLR